MTPENHHHLFIAKRNKTVRNFLTNLENIFSMLA